MRVYCLYNISLYIFGFVYYYGKIVLPERMGHYVATPLDCISAFVTFLFDL